MQEGRDRVGAWCFADHYGPTTIDATRAMDLPGHPHTGLQTVSWLFTGTLEHRDTIGSHALIQAGEMSLMTAGRGIAHSEYSTADTEVLHGVQLWIALPEHERFTPPRFESYAPEPVTAGDARVRVFLGSLAGSTSPVPTSTPLLGAELEIAPGSAVRARGGSGLRARDPGGGDPCDAIFSSEHRGSSDPKSAGAPNAPTAGTPQPSPSTPHQISIDHRV